MNHILINYVLANKRKTELEAQGITVPSDFMMKGLTYGMLAPKIPLLGHIIVDKEVKKLRSSDVTPNDEVPEISITPTLSVNITAVDQNDNQLDKVNFASIPGKLELENQEDLIKVFKEKVFNTASTNKNGDTTLLCPEKKAVTIISIHNKKLSSLYFDAEETPSSLKYKIEIVPEITEVTSSSKNQRSTKSRNTK